MQQLHKDRLDQVCRTIFESFVNNALQHSDATAVTVPQVVVVVVVVTALVMSRKLA